MKRCFVGMRVEDATVQRLRAVRDELCALPPEAARRLRPTRDENLHLTLKFLGPTSPDILGPLRDALARAAAQHVIESAAIVGLDAFPTTERPRAVFGAIDTGRRALVELGRTIDAACEAYGFAEETRPRVPHVTLCRVEGARVGGPLTLYIEGYGRVPLGEVDTNTVVLFESQLRPGGSIYTPLAELPTGGATR